LTRASIVIRRSDGGRYFYIMASQPNGTLQIGKVNNLARAKTCAGGIFTEICEGSSMDPRVKPEHDTM